MNAPVPAAVDRQHRTAEAIALACDRIAPAWPLDRWIAVSPYWAWSAEPMAQAAARLGLIAGLRLQATREQLLERWDAGELRNEHLQAALDRSGSPLGLDALRHALFETPANASRLPLVTDLRDAEDPQALPRWSERVTHQIGQHCAAFFDAGQSRWAPPRDRGLYRGWREALAHDRGLPWPQGRAAALTRLRELPDEPVAAIGTVLQRLALPDAVWPHYLTALLLDLPGWAGWCAGQRWRARLDGGDDDSPVQMLAVRAGWEWLLHDPADGAWTARWHDFERLARQRLVQHRVDTLLQDALDASAQRPLAAALAPCRPDLRPPATAQAVFCIDVRSEVFRRALEAADASVHTRGFAGFFGLPVSYRPAGATNARPQLPGLLAPTLSLDEDGGEVALGQQLLQHRRAAQGRRAGWADWTTAATSAFGFVETCGLAFAVRLLRDTLPSHAGPSRWEHADLGDAARALRPRLAIAEHDPDAAAELAQRVLVGMGLTRDFAPLVLFAGHGSQSANNPLAAGLDCGACGGQSGEVNARALADLLNRPAVRDRLRQRGLDIPAGTCFVGGLHLTTTDELLLFDTEVLPSSHRAALAALRRALAEAGRRARAERAPALGLGHLARDAEALAAALRRRANDWSEPRPEWGLAGNEAFLVAPRARSLGLDLRGRVFLHDYDAAQDADGSVLEAIMTAPMLVAHWINLQYLASCVDPRHFGGGDKLLHNVVGGTLGVFEGNGGDLRTGLARQSLHDGRRWHHVPRRLSVFIAARREAIDTVLARHAKVRELVDGRWLHLFRLAPEGGTVEQRLDGHWLDVGPG